MAYLTYCVRRYVSWRPDPFSIATDAIQISWEQEVGYTFPICLAGPASPQYSLSRLHSHTNSAGLEHSTMVPTTIGALYREASDTTAKDGKPPSRQATLENNQLELAERKVSDKYTLLKEFQDRVQTSCRHDETAGVHQEMLIPFQWTYKTTSSQPTSVFSPGILRRIGPICLPWRRNIGRYSFHAYESARARARNEIIWGCGLVSYAICVRTACACYNVSTAWHIDIAQ